MEMLLLEYTYFLGDNGSDETDGSLAKNQIEITMRLCISEMISQSTYSSPQKKQLKQEKLINTFQLLFLILSMEML